MKYRVIETKEGQFYPQFKPGFFSFWRLFNQNADTSLLMLQRAMETDDPGKASCFGSMDLAQAFIVRIKEKSKKYWDERNAAAIRRMQGINISKKYNF